MRTFAREQFLRFWILPLIFTLGPAVPLPRSVADEKEKDEQAEKAKPQVFVRINGNQFAHNLLSEIENWRSDVTANARLEIIAARRKYGLSEAEVRKLSLAAQGDIKRFDERIEPIRTKFMQASDQSGKIDVAIQVEIINDLHPLRAQLQSGLFGGGSLFEKTLAGARRRAPTPEETRKEAERQTFRYQATIEAAAMTLGDVLLLRDDQRRQLEELLRDETQPPRKFGPHDYDVVMGQLLRLPDSTLRPLLDDVQWRLAQQEFERWKGRDPLAEAGDVLPFPVGPAKSPGIRGTAVPQNTGPIQKTPEPTKTSQE